MKNVSTFFVQTSLTCFKKESFFPFQVSFLRNKLPQHSTCWHSAWHHLAKHFIAILSVFKLSVFMLGVIMLMSALILSVPMLCDIMLSVSMLCVIMLNVTMLSIIMLSFHYDESGSAITNGREPRSCLGWVFNFTLGCFTDNTKIVQHANGHF